MTLEIRFDYDGMGIGVYDDEHLIGYYNGEDHDIHSVQRLIESMARWANYGYKITQGEQPNALQKI